MPKVTKSVMRFSSVTGQRQWQQSCRITSVLQGPVRLPAKLQTGQLQCTVHAHGSPQLPSLRETLFEVDVRQSAPSAGQTVPLPFEQQLLAIVVPQLTQASKRV